MRQAVQLDMICHIHVADVPSRQEVDGTQKVNYRFIANAMADLGFTGSSHMSGDPALVTTRSKASSSVLKS